MTLNRSYLHKIWIFILFIFMFLSSNIKISGGADIYRYLDWAKAFSLRDLMALGEGPGAFSTFVMQWNHGTGLILSLFGASVDAPRMLGLVFSILSFLMLSKLILTSQFESSIKLFFIGVLLVGTHFGHSLFTFSSDAFCCFFILLAYFWAVTLKPTAYKFLLLGICIFFLTILRNQMIIYSIPLAIFVWRQAGMRLIDKAKSLVLFGIPIVLGLIQALMVNRLMTGSYLKSPYFAADENFKTLDLSHPNLIAILFSPWHGLLVYHPIYIVGFLGIVLLALNHLRKNPEFLFLVVVICIHVYIVSAWMCWWFGLGTFGQRGLYYFSIVLAPGLAALIFYKNWNSVNSVLRGLFFLGLSLMSLWSFGLLLHEPNSYTNFYSFAEMIKSQEITFIKHLGVGLFPLFLIKWWRKKEYLRSVGSFFILAYLYLIIFKTFSIENGSISILISMLAMALFWLIEWSLNRSGDLLQGIEKLNPMKWTIVIVGIIFVYSNFVFFDTFVRFGFFSKTPIKKETVLTWADIAATYKEYQNIDGYAEEKERMKNFLLGYCAKYEPERCKDIQ